MLALFHKVCCGLSTRQTVEQMCVRYKYTSPALRKKNRKVEQDMSWVALLLAHRDAPPKPETEPAMFHLVTKIKSLKGRPYREKQIMQSIGFSKEEKKDAPIRLVVKNTEYMNGMLMKVKHLIKITPITFPHGPPQSEDDFEHCYLSDNGEFIVIRDITPDGSKLPVVPAQEPSVWTMDSETLDKHLDRKKESLALNEEYFLKQPVYKKNQDEKEYRYFGDKKFKF